MTDAVLADVDLTKSQFTPSCDRCDKPAKYIAKGCADPHPVLLCDEHYHRGVQVIVTYLRIWQRANKKVMICGDCYRPILSLDTHLEAKYLE
jgi:hypothetical protein